MLVETYWLPKGGPDILWSETALSSKPARPDALQDVQCEQKSNQHLKIMLRPVHIPHIHVAKTEQNDTIFEYEPGTRNPQHNLDGQYMATSIHQ